MFEVFLPSLPPLSSAIFSQTDHELIKHKPQANGKELSSPPYL